MILIKVKNVELNANVQLHNFWTISWHFSHSADIWPHIWKQLTPDSLRKFILPPTSRERRHIKNVSFKIFILLFFISCCTVLIFLPFKKWFYGYPSPFLEHFCGRDLGVEKSEPSRPSRGAYRHFTQKHFYQLLSDLS